MCGTLLTEPFCNTEVCPKCGANMEHHTEPACQENLRLAQQQQADLIQINFSD